MSITYPLIEGKSAWSPSHAVPEFEPSRKAGLSAAHRRYPASIRILGRENIGVLEEPSEERIWASTRYLFTGGRRTVVGRFSVDQVPEEHKWLYSWIRGCCPELKGWWKSQWGWRSPREFSGYRSIENQLGAPHIEPYEVAHMRLPDDVSLDADVVLFAAWCQGVQRRNLGTGESLKDLRDGHADAVRSGLKKLHTSPWFIFMLAAPHMSPAGILFGDAGFIDSTMRMEWLLRHPYQATSEELGAIYSSQQFHDAYAAAVKARARGRAIQPDGGWYANCAKRDALGPSFRRGGRHTKR